MKCRTLFAFALVLATSVTAFADAKDDLAAALKKTADAPNYSWTTTTQGGMGNAEPTTGKYDKDLGVHVNIPGRNGTTEIVSKGKNGVVKTDAGWQKASELANEQGPARFMATQAQDYKTPTTLATEMLAKAENIKAESDGFSGALSEAGAKEQLAFRGGRGGRGGAGAPGGGAAPAMETKNAKATFRAWTKDGAVTKIETKVSGAISFNGQDRDVDRTSTTEFKDVGTTKLTLPEDAKKKLEG